MIVQLNGGLGNQMFQYAVGRAVVCQTGGKLMLDVSQVKNDTLRNYELDKYNIQIHTNRFVLFIYQKIWNQRFRFSFNKKLDDICGIGCEQQEFLYEDVLDKKYLAGYWHNVSYFEMIRDILCNEFRYKGALSQKQKEILQKIKNENSLAIHVRRGDYVSEKNVKIYEQIPKEYYVQAKEYVAHFVDDLHIYIFSDDIKWCKQVFSDWKKVTYVDDSVSGNMHVDFELMKNCKHFIIANSTFSWWASWLADNSEKIIVAPEKWFCNKEKNERVKEALLKGAILL